MVALPVSAAIAPSSATASKWSPWGLPCRGKKWSQVQMLSRPMASASRQARRRSAIGVCCGSSETPTLNCRTVQMLEGAAHVARPPCRNQLRGLGRLNHRRAVLVVLLVLADALFAGVRKLVDLADDLLRGLLVVATPWLSTGCRARAAGRYRRGAGPGGRRPCHRPGGPA